MSRQHPWTVQARTVGSKFGWTRIIDRLDKQAAIGTADFYAKRYPEWEIRLLNEETAEILHIEKASAA